MLYFSKRVLRQSFSLIAIAGLSVTANAHHMSNYIPIERAPAEIPREAYQSGYCCMVYDINSKGATKNIRARYCTEPYLEAPSKAAIKTWHYEKLKKDGTSVKTMDMETHTAVYLADSFGELIPGKHDFLRRINGELNREMPCGEIIS